MITIFIRNRYSTALIHMRHMRKHYDLLSFYCVQFEILYFYEKLQIKILPQYLNIVKAYILYHEIYTTHHRKNQGYGIFYPRTRYLRLSTIQL